MRPPDRTLQMPVRVVVILVLAVWVTSFDHSKTLDYLFGVFANTGSFFSLLLGGIFVAGMFVVFDRAIFCLFNAVLSRRMTHDGQKGDGHKNVFFAFLRAARELRATSAEGFYSDEIIDRARVVALRDTIDGQEIDWGRKWLEFLGTVAPTVGFMGTLVGLIKSFRELGFGGDLAGVLEGLALSMTTSLLGAIISVIFLTTAWFLGRMRQRFDADLNQIIATAQESDLTGVR